MWRFCDKADIQIQFRLTDPVTKKSSWENNIANENLGPNI